MPPCAQTECERLTGTMENRSTCPPASAILMTAESPASPPPTTMTLGAAAIRLSLVHWLSGGSRLSAELISALVHGLARRLQESTDAQQPNAAHHKKESKADDQEAAP